MSFQKAMFDAGLISSDEYEQGRTSRDKKSAKEREKMVRRHEKVSKQRAAGGDFKSPHHFMDHARKDLLENYSPKLIGRLIKQMHAMVDDVKEKDHNEKWHGRLHRFLAKLGQKLEEMTAEERQEFLQKPWNGY